MTGAVSGNGDSTSPQVDMAPSDDASQEEALVEIFEQGIFNANMGNTQVSNVIQSEARSQFQQLQSGQ